MIDFLSHQIRPSKFWSLKLMSVKLTKSPTSYITLTWTTFRIFWTFSDTFLPLSIYSFSQLWLSISIPNPSLCASVPSGPFGRKGTHSRCPSRPLLFLFFYSLIRRSIWNVREAMGVPKIPAIANKALVGLPDISQEESQFFGWVLVWAVEWLEIDPISEWSALGYFHVPMVDEEVGHLLWG